MLDNLAILKNNEIKNTQLTIDNPEIRRLCLETNGLVSGPQGPLNVLAIIKKLGFVQLDTIQNVSRAHHHILLSRHLDYRDPMPG